MHARTHVGTHVTRVRMRMCLCVYVCMCAHEGMYVYVLLSESSEFQSISAQVLKQSVVAVAVVTACWPSE